MQPLPKTLADEIESLEELDARALKKKYQTMLADATKCASSHLEHTRAARLSASYLPFRSPSPQRKSESCATSSAERDLVEPLVRLVPIANLKG